MTRHTSRGGIMEMSMLIATKALGIDVQMRRRMDTGQSATQRGCNSALHADKCRGAGR